MANAPGRPKGPAFPTGITKVEYLMTIPQVAAYFKVSDQTVRLWVSRGQLQAYRLPPDDGLLDIPPSERRSTLYVTRKAMADWAEIYYKLL